MTDPDAGPDAGGLQVEAPHPNGSGDGAAPPRPRRRRLIRAGLAAFVAVWVFAIWYSVSRPAEEVLDAASTSTIRAACADAGESLVTLASRTTADDTLTDVAARVIDENEIFTEMITSLRAVEPPDPEGSEALSAWLDDWDDVVAARARFAEERGAGGNARLELPSDGVTKPVTVRMNEYAEAHGLRDCTPRMLQAEVVEGERRYSGVTTASE